MIARLETKHPKKMIQKASPSDHLIHPLRGRKKTHASKENSPLQGRENPPWGRRTHNWAEHLGGAWPTDGEDRHPKEAEKSHTPERSSRMQQETLERTIVGSYLSCAERKELLRGRVFLSLNLFKTILLFINKILFVNMTSKNFFSFFVKI